MAAALRRFTGLFRNSLLQSPRCVRIRNLSLDVDDNVSGITDEQKQVGFPTIVRQSLADFTFFLQHTYMYRLCTVLVQFCFGQLIHWILFLARVNLRAANLI